MFHGHEDDVDDEAEDDPQVKKRACDKTVEVLFDPPPAATTIPLQAMVDEQPAAWRTSFVVRA